VLCSVVGELELCGVQMGVLKIRVMYECDRATEQPKECRFSPYQNNGGTCLAIAGKDFCVVAADSRLSLGYSILSRTSPKVAQLTTKCCIASSGCQADMITLQKYLKFRLQVCSAVLTESRFMSTFIRILITCLLGADVHTSARQGNANDSCWPIAGNHPV
jgi:20S proteasome alpha/beta subunit